MVGQLSNAMTGSGRIPGPWLFALPSFATITFIFDQFDLGQPNLMLLAMMLYGFWLLQRARPWMAGSMFALATAIKVFPVAVLPYLVWRREWKATASTLVFLGLFLFVLPGPFRGFEHNAAELKTWYRGMVGTSSEKGFGQRDEQNWSWVNQSIIAVTHRLLRPVNYNQDDPYKPPRTMNVANLDFKTANYVVAAISLAIGLGFLAVMPPASQADGAVGCRRARHIVLPDDGGLAFGAAILFHVAVLSDRDPRSSRRLRSAAARAGRHLGPFGTLRGAHAAVAAVVPERPAGLGQQSRRHRRADGGPRLAPAAPAARPCLRRQARYNLTPTAPQIKETAMANAQLQPVLDHIDADFDNSLARLFDLLRIKSISADPAFAEDCKKAADHLAKDIATIGFKAEVRPTAGHPAIVAKANGNAGRPHVLFYGHYDVQPVDPLNLWHRPPFEPVVTDHADGSKIIVARGAEDDKGQLMTFVEACRAWKKVTGSLPVDVTMLIEGEEEVGSKNFVPFMEANKSELKADFALVCDTSMWDPNTPAITTSLRGLMYDEVTIKAANRDLHSGIFGGGARNPIRVLTHILGGLFDDDGRITHSRLL